MSEPMEILRSNLSRVRIPETTERIYKEQCCIFLDTPRSDGGLYIDMSTFLAFGKKCVDCNYKKTGNTVYLHIRRTKKAVVRPLKKPTLSATGIDGGFDNKEPEYSEILNIVILPDYVTISFPSVELPEKVRLAVDAILMAEDAEKKQMSAYAMNPQQIDSDVIIPPSGWKCA